MPPPVARATGPWHVPPPVAWPTDLGPFLRRLPWPTDPGPFTPRSGDGPWPFLRGACRRTLARSSAVAVATDTGPFPAVAVADGPGPCRHPRVPRLRITPVARKWGPSGPTRVAAAMRQHDDPSDRARYLGTALSWPRWMGVVRRRFRLWYSFALYLVAVATYSCWSPSGAALPHSTGGRRPDRRQRDTARHGRGREFREFRRFPGRWSHAASLLVIHPAHLRRHHGMPTHDNRYTTFVGRSCAVLNGTIWLFTALAA